MDKNDQQTRLEEGGASEITVRNAAQKLQVHRYFDNPVASPRSSITDEGEKAGQK
ncbi:hypothetical protein SEEGA711_11709 [Salmonella enterica subsp. enterica serovar Gaminara str. ATCC BAA-711]|nr:hypothetical protein SEEGA711_11709 [Salmonella enterica subsp. enterica serovar Gaminara str. ATCC BAA-711]ETC62763.1 hypothetical protein SEEE3402_24285 [Salmonella enterica subsp. enterica serovar Enteritidis str. 3402]